MLADSRVVGRYLSDSVVVRLKIITVGYDNYDNQFLSTWKRLRLAVNDLNHVNTHASDVDARVFP